MRIVGPATNTTSARIPASTMLMFESHWMPLAMPVTAEATNAMVSTTMMPTSSASPTAGTPLSCNPAPICSAPRPSEAADPNSVAKIARMSTSLPKPPSVCRSPSSGANAELISCRRPRRNVE
jgi:hypothetical protein